jgi:methyl-accepting chemotaxis protein WspA
LIDLPPRRFVDIGHYQALKDSIKAGEEFLGTAVIGLDTTQRDEAKWDNVKVTLISSLVLAALGIAFILYLTHTVIITPVDYSVVIAQQVATGDLSAEVEAKSNDEMGQLLKAFQEMTANLRALIGQTQRSGIQITSSVTEIAASGKELEATVTEQAASTNEVVATAKEISATSQELVQTMNDVSNMADVAVVSADNGQQGLVSMESTMRQMEEATQSISSKLAVINEKAANITSVVTTITKVADQTNLLSLNAAIEAEKAGEYGVGFAVVAREVRRLADQTAVATLDIEQTVKEMRSAVAAGVMSMDKFSEEVRQGVDVVRNVGTQLAQIIEQVQALTPRFESVLEGMGAQAQGAQQISESMIQLNEGAQQTADSLRETNHALGQLTSASHDLQEEIAHFKVG